MPMVSSGKVARCRKNHRLLPYTCSPSSGEHVTEKIFNLIGEYVHERRSYSTAGVGLVNLLQYSGNQDCEDRLVIDEEEGIFGIADGHGGSQIAEYISQQLPSFLPWCLQQEQGTKLAEFEHHKGVMRAMKKAFQCLDFNMMMKFWDVEQNGAKLEKPSGGAVSCVSWFQGNDIFVANTGDCRAVLGYLGDDKVLRTHDITTDHTLTCESEKERVRREHPGISDERLFKDGRLMGLVVPTRVLGDFELKHASYRRYADMGEWAFPYATAAPDVFRVQRTGREKFMVIASDGLWDALTSAEVAKIVWANRARSGNVCDMLMQEVAARIGQRFNVTPTGTPSPPGSPTQGMDFDDFSAKFRENASTSRGRFRRSVTDDISIVVIFFEDAATTLAREERSGPLAVQHQLHGYTIAMPGDFPTLPRVHYRDGIPVPPAWWDMLAALPTAAFTASRARERTAALGRRVLRDLCLSVTAVAPPAANPVEQAGAPAARLDTPDTLVSWPMGRPGHLLPLQHDVWVPTPCPPGDVALRSVDEFFQRHSSLPDRTIQIEMRKEDDAFLINRSDAGERGVIFVNGQAVPQHFRAAMPDMATIAYQTRRGAALFMYRQAGAGYARSGSLPWWTGSDLLASLLKRQEARMVGKRGAAAQAHAATFFLAAGDSPEQRIPLPCGKTVIGRGWNGLNDLRISSEHIELTVGDKCTARILGRNGTLFRRHAGESFFLAQQGQEVDLVDGNQIAIIPDFSTLFSVKVEQALA